MKRGLKIVVSWLCLFSLLISPLTASGAGTTSGDPVWPNPGAIQLSKTAEPTGKSGEWKITLKAEGKNLRTSSDVVLVIDKSGSMNEKENKKSPTRLEKAKEAANKFVENLLQKDAETRIAVVSFNSEAKLNADFYGPNNKTKVNDAINSITASGGTNIQAGLQMARNQLSTSTAKNKLIVLLSDGKPTYSFKGTSATKFNWSENSYGFAINAFDYGKRLGSGGDFTFEDYDCYWDWFVQKCKNDSYKINNYKISDNGIGTISEAKIAKDKGLKIFSVGLDVSNDSSAIKVLKDIQSEGYYSGSSEDLVKIFREMAGKISFAAQDAKVIDPMGDMFNLKLKGAVISPDDYSVSQGTVTWDSLTEKFTWNVGNIAEGDPAIFTYTVVMDQSKNPVSDVLYPTNGTTTIEYKDVNNRNVSKEFEVPKVSIGKGSILMKGYKVNANGKPINAEGVEVEAPEFAEALYSEYYKDQNGKEAFPMGSTHSVTAKVVEKFRHKVGESPSSITLTVTNPNPVIWFGYEKAVEQNLSIKYLEKYSGKQLKDPDTTKQGYPGSKVSLEALTVEGYSVVGPDKVDYTFTAEPNQEYIFYYTANEQSVQVQYLEEGTNKELAGPDTKPGKTGQTLKLEAKTIAGYTVVGETTVDYKLGVENAPHIFYYTANEQDITVKYLDRATGDKLAEPSNMPGVTGKKVTLEAVEVTGYTPENETFEYTVQPEGNEYIFYYTANEQSVQVQYLEEGTNKELAGPDTKPGKTGQTLKLEAKTIAGYTVVGETTVDYKLGVENAPHIFYYTANEQDITVKYVDRATGDKLAEPSNVPGVTGKKVTLEAVEVTGYTPENETFEYTVQPEGNEYIFYYTANEQSVQVKYLEEGTNKELAGPDTKPGKTGQTLKLEAKTIAGYTVVGETTVDYKLGVENAPHIFYYTANEQDITVKYVDRATGDKLAEPSNVPGVTGKKVTLEAVEVTGYTPENETFEYTVQPEGNEYIFYYTANEQSVQVQYLEEGTNKELAGPDTKPGKTGQTLKLEAKTIAGYTVVGETTVDYKLGVENAPHIFYYTANEQDITVKYVDRATGDKLAEPSNVPGVTGKKVILEAVEVTGYTPENETFQYMVQPEGNEYIFYYKANEPDNNRTLTVRYVDLITGNDLLDPTEHSGKVGEEITLTANDYTDSVTGAVYKPHDYSVPYTFKNEPLHDVFTFTYTQDVSSLERTVLVHHVDRESNLPLMEPTPASGKVGETIILKAGPISVADAVYMPEEFSYNYTVTLDLEQEFTIYYNLGEPSGDVVKLTISYLDRETNGEIASQEVIEGKAGTQFTLNAKNVPGYTPEIPSFEYRYSDEPNQNYVFYYTKNAPTDQQLTVKYLLNGTNEQLASPSVFTGKPGETKTLTAVSISGYTPVKSTDAYTFTTQAGQEYIFYYTRNSSNPGGSGGSDTSSGSTVTPLPALPPLPAVPPTLEMENHYDYINGYPDGSVKPLNNITREEVAAIFYRLLDDESRSEYLKTGNSFSDVGATRWSNKHISTMENAGVITGYPDGTFKPGQYITRAEFAAIASRFDKLDERANDSFTDITGHWAEKYIASAANNGWIKGYTDGTFKPNQYITRAEAAAFINSVLNRKVDKDGIHEDAKMWPDNVYGKWYYYDILEATNHHDYSREEEAEVEVWEEVLPNRVYP
ncbi:MucBP domain-containing protein [Paenibacillus vini]|uniref:VWFA domain-containing protein n=1 Tax=Paenibacillus vini TaxID=1476024 RepID=A0ABQ4MBN7_9BACL|nr:MucBP domain-containing protein [Paenibacillus vini]GIP53396.1 hypothetical protein J42TS3_24310 [Paenibacillus vini]